MVTDLSNKISQMDHWDPSKLFNPNQPTMPQPKLLPLDIPIVPALEMSVLPPPTQGRVDVFIDNLINVFLNTVENQATQLHGGPLAVL